MTRFATSLVCVLALGCAGVAAAQTNTSPPAARVGAGVFAWSGLYNIGADDAHTRPVYSMLEMVRERSVTARARELHPPPNLNDAARIRQGAGNYNAMCTGCHLAPGMAETELSKGLYPSPPDLSTADVGDPSHHFWVIKHGIKASGMPAWGASMDDAYIWNMVAFLQVLPKLNASQYQSMVASSGGHSHGGGETKPHEGPAGQDHHQMDGMNMDDVPSVGSSPHVDAPGAHDEGPAARQHKPHVDPPGAPPHSH